MNQLELFKGINTFILDVDGVLTNGNLIVHENGDLIRTMNIKDGYALQLAVKKGYHVIIISGGSSEGAQKRLAKLGITHLNFKVKDKVAVLNQAVKDLGINLNEALYMGDDMPDIITMQMCQLKAAPHDACEEILQIANYISPYKGGEGCVRDVIRKVLLLNNHWE